MVKSITKVGNSQGVIFDSALMELAHLKVGDQMSVTVHEGGAITLTPLRERIAPEDARSAIQSVMADYAETMKKLA